MIREFLLPIAACVAGLFALICGSAWFVEKEEKWLDKWFDKKK